MVVIAGGLKFGSGTVSDEATERERRIPAAVHETEWSMGLYA